MTTTSQKNFHRR